MTDPDSLKESILAQLKAVIDPETGADVIRMRLVQDLTVGADGMVTYTFRPSSPLCPIALPLIISIIEAVKSVPGVTHQVPTVVDYAGAEELNKILAGMKI
jgi:metal-sulfur cluster biosynthetic enzyme